jgi:hypothetical protein
LHEKSGLGAARFLVHLDDREVAELPEPTVAGWRNPYTGRDPLIDLPSAGIDRPGASRTDVAGPRSPVSVRYAFAAFGSIRVEWAE